MRRSLMILVVLLFTALGSTSAHADTIVSSGIDGITIDGTTYNVTFGTTEDTTFAGNLTDATLAAQDIANDINTLDIYLPFANGFLSLAVDGGTYSPTICFNGGYVCPTLALPPWTVYPTILTTNIVLANMESYPFSPPVGWVEFAAVSTPEPGAATLTLTGVGLLGLVVVMRKRKAPGLAQAT
jgi:hypothetical protein